MDSVRSLSNLPLPPHSTDLFDRALLEPEKSNYDAAIALERMSWLTAKDFDDLIDWAAEEVAGFEEGIRTHGHNLYEVSKFVPSKQYKDVVRYFYKWKKTHRYEPVYSEWTRIYRPTKKFKKHDGCAAVEAVNDQKDISEDDAEMWHVQTRRLYT